MPPAHQSTTLPRVLAPPSKCIRMTQYPPPSDKATAVPSFVRCTSKYGGITCVDSGVTMMRYVGCAASPPVLVPRLYPHLTCTTQKPTTATFCTRSVLPKNVRFVQLYSTARKEVGTICCCWTTKYSHGIESKCARARAEIKRFVRAKTKPPRCRQCSHDDIHDYCCCCWFSRLIVPSRLRCLHCMRNLHCVRNSLYISARFSATRVFRRRQRRFSSDGSLSFAGLLLLRQREYSVAPHGDMFLIFSTLSL